MTVTYSVEELEKEAAAIDALSSEGQPLHGVPVLIKDALNVKGLQTTLGRSGSPKFDEPKATDAVVVTRLRDAGALVVGKTNMPRDGMDVQTFNSRFGVTGNVFALQRTAGGSSGGSAVAVATGMVPVRLSLSIYLHIYNIYLSIHQSISLPCMLPPPCPHPSLIKRAKPKPARNRNRHRRKPSHPCSLGRDLLHSPDAGSSLHRRTHRVRAYSRPGLLVLRVAVVRKGAAPDVHVLVARDPYGGGARKGRENARALHAGGSGRVPDSGGGGR